MDPNRQPPPLSPPSNLNPGSSNQAPQTQPPHPSTSSQTHIPQDDIFRRVQTYPFHSDSSYQSGLSTILGHPSTPATASELSTNTDLILQAQCFYFARKYGLDSIDVPAYRNFLSITASLQQDHQAYSQTQISQRNSETPPLLKPDPVPRPSAPTPNSASAAPISSTQQISQTLSPSPLPPTTTTTPASTNPDSAPPYPTSFADIVDLITQNKPIPGIETIPDTVLEPGSSKQDRTAKRRKPWEVTEEGTQQTVAGVPSTTTMDGEASTIDTPKQRPEGIMRILQPDAVTESDLLAKD